MKMHFWNKNIEIPGMICQVGIEVKEIKNKGHRTKGKNSII